MSSVRVVGASVGLLLVAAGVAPVAQSPTLETVRVRLGGNRTPVLAAEMNGIFGKYGIALKRVRSPTGGEDAVWAALAGGDIEIVHSIVDNAVALEELGGADVIVVAGGAGSPYELIAQPGNASVQDLRGKTLLIHAPNTALAVQMKKILMLNGLAPGVDVQFRTGVSGARRLEEMRANRNMAAAMMGLPASVLARRDGFVSLGTSTKLIGPLQGTSVYVSRRWARAHAGLLERYLAAVVEAQRWVMSPANMRKVVELIAAEWDVPRDVAAEAYDIQMGPGGWNKDLRFDVEAFRNLLALRAEVEGTWGGKPPAPEKYYAPSYYEKALARLKERR